RRRRGGYVARVVPGIARRSIPRHAQRPVVDLPRAGPRRPLGPPRSSPSLATRGPLVERASPTYHQKGCGAAGPCSASGRRLAVVAPYDWLVIPKAHRPPTHYQLLGVTPGESDPAIIQDASDLRLEALLPHFDGPHAALADRLQQELADARDTLLD